MYTRQEKPNETDQTRIFFKKWFVECKKEFGNMNQEEEV